MCEKEMTSFPLLKMHVFNHIYMEMREDAYMEMREDALRVKHHGRIKQVWSELFDDHLKIASWYPMIQPPPPPPEGAKRTLPSKEFFI